MNILPEYLRNQASEACAVIDHRDWQVSLGLRHHIRRHVTLAQEFAGWVQATADFELAA